MKFSTIKGPQNKNLVRPEGKSVIWVRFYRVGKGRLERSLKTDVVTEARIRRDEEIAKFLGIRAKHKSNVKFVDDLFPQFLEQKKQKSKATHDSLTNQWENHLKEYFSGMTLDEVSNTEWLRYVAKKRQNSPDRKFFNDQKCLSGFLNWCHRDGLIERLPKLENVDPEIDAGKVYSNEEIKLLIQNSSSDLCLQIMMAVTMGMRVGEILFLEWSQIDWEKLTIHLPAAKTKIRKARTFGISDAVIWLLKDRAEQCGSEWVFPSPVDPSKSVGKGGNRKAWTTCRANAGVSGRFHDLRHTFLTHAFKISVNPALICNYAGLSLAEAEKTYLHFTPDDTRVVASLVRF